MRSSEFEHHLELVTEAESNDSVSREDVNKHEESGSARLREEELLVWSLSEVRAHVRQISPAPEIEQRVMKAFDLERQNNQRHSHSWPRYATTAIAAALLLMGSVSFALWRRQPPRSFQLDRTPIDLSTAVATVEIGETIQPEVRNVKPRERKLRPAGNPISRDAKMVEAPAEIATDFIRINYATPIEPGSQMIRVQLPRSAMSQFGLPVNMDRADQPVKADVIMGLDGVAQAIRFVQ